MSINYFIVNYNYFINFSYYYLFILFI